MVLPRRLKSARQVKSKGHFGVTEPCRDTTHGEGALFGELVSRRFHRRCIMKGECEMPTFSAGQILTASIAPVIVISGVGLLLLSITNRYGRAIDRVRLLARELEEIDTESAQRRLGDQLRFTNQRAHVLRSSMLSASGQQLLRVTDSPLTVRGATPEVAKRLHRPAVLRSVPDFAGGGGELHLP